ncbi:serine/threonine-protein kinase 19 [Dorcoceras hygrometricum]|uniref:Serine/threonine-protein kinase 19 n=1 Tax=Dorcoceras hygrometricum TaxID=472368 RepID=A0A2Z7AI59_9LAMI|nr:serine/threonine-protein kinase 19 [Dorcoceras hygrometricum]
MGDLQPSTFRKRPRDQKSREETDPENVAESSRSSSFDEDFAFSDTLVALQMMRAQFPAGEKVPVRPFVLRSQLYSSVIDRTQVDRDLESLRRDRVLRVFKLNTGQDDHAIMFMDDYVNQIEGVMRRLEEKKQNDVTVFEWFKMHVIPSKLDTSIGHEELCSLMSLGGVVKENHITQLINAGLLVCQLIDRNMYWFSIPNIGSVLKGLSQGRKELLSLLNRKRYKEMLLATLEKQHLRLSPLDIRFHLRDLIGSGHLKTVQTPSGLVVRVAKD